MPSTPDSTPLLSPRLFNARTRMTRTARRVTDTRNLARGAAVALALAGGLGLAGCAGATGADAGVARSQSTRSVSGAAPAPASQPAHRAPASQPAAIIRGGEAFAVLPPVPAGHETAVFAGGCFWCMEKDLETVDGVKAAISGYIGGHVKDPTYRQVSSRTSGHAEAVWVLFDPKVVSYDALLDFYWRHIDPTTADRQFCDVGDEYRPEIFTTSAAQASAATRSKAALAHTKPFKAPIVVRISPAGTFYPAEVYHQDFYKKNPVRYHSYRAGCGRDARVRALWGT